MTSATQENAGGTRTLSTPSGAAGTAITLLARMFSVSMAELVLAFLVNNYLNFWRDWPGLPTMFAHLGWYGFEPLQSALDGGTVTLGWIQFALYAVPVALIVTWVAMTPGRTLRADSEMLSNVTAYIVRAAFWAVLLIGVADMVISFLRVEGLLTSVVGKDLASDLGRSRYRGQTVHYPLVVVSLVIARFSRSLGFTWLTLLIVVAEIQIVITRFVFSYEQAFMGDLVRFWYGALFLFASPYTLLHEGHVRVDILYAGFSERGKAWTNLMGSLLLGIPLCWVILTQGLWGKFNVINGPLLSYEVTQSGYGMYVKYFLAAFLLVFAVTMMIQFASYLLSAVAVLVDEAGHDPDTTERANV